jgi:CubicO group peptidase (beta-lactamase class C family)
VTLGFAVAGAAQRTYPDLLAGGITSELGMVDTFAGKIPPKGSQPAQGYSENSAPVPVTAAADIKSTARDMLAWLAAVYQAMALAARGSGLSPLQQAIAETTRVWIQEPFPPPPPLTPPLPPPKPEPFSMGLGWQIPTVTDTTRAHYPIVVKDGATGGYSCWIGLTTYDPQIPPVGVALLTNQRGVIPDRCGRTILQQIVDCPVSKETS